MAQKRKLDGAQVLAIIEQYNKGVPVSQIAVSMNLPLTSVWREAQRHKNNDKPKEFFTEELRANVIKTFVEDGLSHKETAKVCKVSKSSVQKILNAAGISRKRVAKPAPPPKTARRRLTLEQELDIVAKYKAKNSALSIAKAFEIAPNTVRGVLERHGVPKNEELQKNSPFISAVTDDNERIILHRYCDLGESANSISKNMGIPVTTIRRTIERNDIEKNEEYARERLTPEEKALIIQHGLAGKTLQTIAYIVNRSKQSVFRALKEHEIKMEMGRPRSCTLNESALDALTPLVLYWMGFLFTDGCVSGDDHGSPSVRINIAEKDREHLEKFLRVLGSNHAISRGNLKKKTTYGGGPSVSIKIRSKQLVAALMVCGMEPSKEKRRPINTLLYSRDFWRGAVDGDGWLGMTINNDKYLYPHIGLCGQDFFIEGFQKFMIDNGLSRLDLDRTDSGIWKVATCAPRARDIIELLYKDPCEALTRKNNRAQAIISGDFTKSTPYTELPSCVAIDEEEDLDYDII